jgi:beta-lactamase class A
MKKAYLAPLLTLVVGLAAGLSLGFWLGGSAEPAGGAQEVYGGDYEYINPLLACEGVQTTDRQLRALERRISDEIAEIDDRGEASHVSVYFRDLNGGNWFGIAENELFTPASLFKVPTLLAVLKMAETDPAFLDQEIVPEPLEEQVIVDMYYAPAQEPSYGQAYTVRELLEYMIRYSSNVAVDALLTVIPEDYYFNLDRELGLNVNIEGATEDFMSVRSYASIFRILYNASYLSRNMSESALALLTQAAFDEGLLQVIPAQIRVAHKFGERTELDESGEVRERQLHECGIVYYPDHPYLLCVMTRGRNFELMSRVLGNISEIVYKDTEQRYAADI